MKKDIVSAVNVISGSTHFSIRWLTIAFSNDKFILYKAVVSGFAMLSGVQRVMTGILLKFCRRSVYRLRGKLCSLLVGGVFSAIFGSCDLCGIFWCYQLATVIRPCSFRLFHIKSLIVARSVNKLIRVILSCVFDMYAIFFAVAEGARFVRSEGMLCAADHGSCACISLYAALAIWVDSHQ